MKNTDLLNFISNTNPVLTFNGKDYQVKKSYKVTLALEAMNREIERKAEESEDYNITEAQFNLMFNFFTMAVSEEFSNAVKEGNFSESDLANIVTLIQKMRGGLTMTQAIEEMEKEEEKEEKKA